MPVDSDPIHVHTGDLPAGIDWGNSVAVDTETMGLNPHRDRLCLVQVSPGDGSAHLVKFEYDTWNTFGVQSDIAPNLAKLLVSENVVKIFHFARFDVAALYKWMDISCSPIYCTKIASRLARTYTDRHGLKDLCRELLSIELSKEQQSSDWGTSTLTEQQIEYAARDVLYLHRIRDALDEMLRREGRIELASACFRFLPFRARLDVDGWPDTDIFAY